MEHIGWHWGLAVATILKPDSQLLQVLFEEQMRHLGWAMMQEGSHIPLVGLTPKLAEQTKQEEIEAQTVQY